MFTFSLRSRVMLVMALVALVNIQTVFAEPFKSSWQSKEPVTQQQIEALSKVSQTCAGAEFEKECTDSKAVAKHMSEAWLNQDNKLRLKIWSLGVRAALVAVEKIESGDWRYNINHNPGLAGQGTKAMLMYNHLFRFAVWIDEEKVTKIIGKNAKELADKDNDNDINEHSNEIKNKVRDVVLNNENTFRASGWYLRYRCKNRKAIYGDLMNKGMEGYSRYLKECVGVEMDENRKKAYCYAVKGLKPEKMDLPSECPKDL